MSNIHELTESIDEHDHGTVKSYIVGFLLSIGLTILAFWLVGDKVLSTAGTYVALSVLALIQLFVQVTFFLHLNTQKHTRWNLTSFLFATFVVVIIAGGSLWIMYNLNVNMV